MEPELNFNDKYAEQILLPSGENIRLRLVRPNDKVHLRRGFAALSAASRKKRFLAGKNVLSDAELRYFTELDQLNHFAVGALSLNAEGDENEGAGVARFVRFPSDRRCAEVAIAVIDGMQGKGIGSLLLPKLAAAARERGVERFRFDCLSYNLEMQGLLRKVCHGVTMVHKDGISVAEAKLAESGSILSEGPRDAAA